jgi:hypothetical protein
MHFAHHDVQAREEAQLVGRDGAAPELNKRAWSSPSAALTLP